MLKRLLLALAFVVGLAAETYAATYYVDACTNNLTTYNAATRSCTTGAARVYSSIPNACLGGLLAPGDIVDVRAGTYTSGVRTSQCSWPSGTNLGAGAITIQAHPGETVTCAPTSGGCVVLEGVANLIIKNFIFDGISCTTCLSNSNEAVWLGSTVDVASAAHHIRLDGNECKRWKYTCVQLNHYGHHNEYINGSAHDSDPVCTLCYGFYISGPDMLIERNKIYNMTGWGIHTFSGYAEHPDRTIIRYNEVYNTGADGLSDAILAGLGNGIQVYGNVVRDNYSDGINSSSGAVNTLIYNNSVYNNCRQTNCYGGLVWGSGNGTRFVNNISYGNNQNGGANFADSDGTQTPTFVTNLCGVADVPHCAIVADPLFINAAGGVFALQAGSPAINAGTAAIATGVTRAFNGAAPDIGAFETFGAVSAEVGIVSTSTIDITFTDNVAQPLLPASAIMGFTTTCGTISSAARSGNTHIRLVLAAPWGGGACTYSYSTGTGNVSNSALVGNTLNQRLNAITTVTVTDNTGGGGGPTLAYTHGKFFLLQGVTNTTWVAKGAEDANITTAPGSMLNWLWKVANTGTLVNLNARVRVRYDGGSIVELTDSFVNGVSTVGNGAQLGTVMSDGAALTADQLTSTHSNVACTYTRTGASSPTLVLTTNSEAECAKGIKFATTVTPGKVYDFYVYTDTGTLVGGPMSVTIGSYASAR